MSDTTENSVNEDVENNKINEKIISKNNKRVTKETKGKESDKAKESIAGATAKTKANKTNEKNVTSSKSASTKKTKKTTPAKAKSTTTKSTTKKEAISTTKKTNKNSKKAMIDSNLEKSENGKVKIEDTKEKEDVINDKVKNEEIIAENSIIEDVDDKENVIEDESKYGTISLKEIREAIENKVDNKQKKSVIKEILINCGIAIIMVLHLIIIMMGCKNITPETLDKDMKIITLFVLLIGIIMLEISYKKDNFKIAMHGIEVLVFGATNLCLIYIAKLYYGNLIKVLSYIGIGVAGYYIFKSIIISITSIKRFKKDNNDIKDIVHKKKKIEV